jgi:cytochrome c-type biogenesis protein CcmH
MSRPPPARVAWCAVAVVVMVGVAAVPATTRLQEPPSPTTQPAPLTPEQQRLEQRTREIASQLRCPVCQGLSIEESGSDIALEMRSVVREQLAEGRSPAEVKEFFVRAYGEWVLLQPRAEGFNLTIYVLPVVLLLGGAALVVFLVRRWTHRRPTPAAPPGIEEDPDLAPWSS